MPPIALTSAWVSALWPFLVATGVSLAVVPVSMWLAHRVGAVDDPDDERRIHSEPTPRLGGIALFAGFATAVAIFGGPVPGRWGVVAVCAAITVTMAIDDILHLPWWAKLVIEVSAGLAVAAAGITITFFALPGPHGSIVYQLGWLALPVTIAWVVGMQTSINFLDGSDGVAAGVVAIVAMVSLLAAINRLESPNDVQNGTVVLSGALMGCCAGFLVFNLPPARVFMGDGGSHFLGVALAVITILGVAKVAVALSLFVPLIALGLPIGDTAFAIVRRRRAGRSMAQPDSEHLHHRLLARGLTPLETAVSFYLMTAILGCLALAIFGHRTVLAVAIVLLVLALAALWWRNRRRRGRAPTDEEGYLMVTGRRAGPSRIHHSGETD